MNVSAAVVDADADAEPVAAVGERARRAWVRAAVVVGIFALFPHLPFVSFSVLGSANLAAYYALVALSLVVLTGWVGQISLGHAGLVGIGAYVAGHVVNGWHVTFPVSLLWAALAGAAVAGGLGAVAVRVRGLYLAVATLIFSWMAAEYLFRQRWFTRNGAITVESFGEPGTIPYFDWRERTTHFYAAWAVVAAVVVLAANLRDSRTGRAFFAVRGSEFAAASLGISVQRTKVVAFAVSGAIAAMAGNLLLVRDQVVTPESFRVEVSLFFLAVAVVGGLSSLGGAVAAAVLFASLNELFFRFTIFTGYLEVVPPLLLTATLLLYRGGLAAIPAALGPRLQPLWARLPSLPPRAKRRRRPARQPGRVAALLHRLAPPPRVDPASSVRSDGPDRLDLTAAVAALAGSESNGNDSGGTKSMVAWRGVSLPVPALDPDRQQRTVLLEADEITVRFGGVVANDQVSLTVREHEIVGLIGPNGAGKTTMFNAIAGLNRPSSGRVRIFGHDVTDWTVDERARLGVGRTFQAIQLLPQLTVFDNLLVATHVNNGSGFVANLFAAPSSVAAESAARASVHEAASLLDLESVLDRVVADLPFGVLRMVEVARALVTGSRLIMLDEPASGLDSTETDRLAELLRFVRALGATLLLIEHDVRMVTAVCDHLYVLDYGKLLADGPADEVRTDPRVIAAYLGEEADPATDTAGALVEASS